MKIPAVSNVSKLTSGYTKVLPKKGEAKVIPVATDIVRSLSFTRPDGAKVSISYRPYDKFGNPVSIKDVIRSYKDMQKAPKVEVSGPF